MMKKQFKFALMMAGCLLWSSAAHALLVDGGFNNTSFDAEWNENVIQSGNPSDTITYDQATTPGTLFINYVDEQGSDQSTHVTRTDIRLDRVGDYVEADVQLVGGTLNVVSLVGVGLLWTDSLGSIDRSNSIYLALRGDGQFKLNAYGDAGAEIGDWNTPTTATEMVTVRLVRETASTITAYYGDGGSPAVNAGPTIDFSAHTNMPVYPSIYLAAGLSSYASSVDNFRVGNLNDPADDKFTDDILSLNWDPNNYILYSGLGDTITLTEANNRLNIDYQNTSSGAFQVTGIMRDDLTLSDGEAVVMAVRILSGEATPNVAVGLLMAPTGNGINNDRSNTLWHTLRNDGIVRTNPYGAAGAELPGDTAVDITASYTMGDWVTLRLERSGNLINGYYGQGYLAEATTSVGAAFDFSSASVPTVPGIMLTTGLADFTAEVEYFLVGVGIVPVELSDFEVE